MTDFLVELKISGEPEDDERGYPRRKSVVDVTASVSPDFAARIAKEMFSLLSEREPDAEHQPATD